MSDALSDIYNGRYYAGEPDETTKPGCFGAWGLPSCNIPGCAWFARCKQSREDY